MTFASLKQEGKSKQNGGQLSIVIERSRTLIITRDSCWAFVDPSMTSYSNGMWAKDTQSILISFDLQFGFSAFDPKNEVNFRISRIALDSAIKDDCKYSTYTHIFLSYQIAFCLAYF